MLWEFSFYESIMLFVALLSAALAALAWRRRSVPGALPFVVMMLAVAEWSGGYALELGGLSLSAKVLWAKVQYLGIIVTPVAWLAIALQYTGRDHWLTRRNLLLLALVPALTLASAWSNEAHGLLWSHVTLGLRRGGALLEVVHGPWFWVHTTYSYSLLFVGTLLMARAYDRTRALYRRQQLVLMVGIVTPWAANLVHLLWTSRLWPVDITSLAFGLSGALFYIGLFRFSLFDIVPVARDALLEHLDDSVFVLDERNRIVDLNAAAQAILGQEIGSVIGKPAGEVFSRQADLLQRYREVSEAHDEVLISSDGNGQRSYDLRIAPLRDKGNRLTGRLIVLHDISERKEIERALRESEQRYRKLFESEYRHVQEAALLNQVRAALARELDLQSIFRTIVEAIANTYGYNLVSLYLLEGDTLVEQYHVGYAQIIARIPISQGVMGRVVRTGQPVLLDDVHSDPAFLGAIEGIISEVCVPLLDQERVVGTLNVESTQGVHLTEDDLRLMLAVSEHAGIAISRARLYDALRQTRDELELRVGQRTAELTQANRELQQEIAEHRRTEEALRESETRYRQAQKMEAVGRLAGGVAHDFNNLLLVINGCSEILLNDLAPDDPRRQDAQEIHTAGERAAGLTRQLLAFSRRQTLEVRPINLNELVNGLTKMLRRMIGEDITLVFRSAPELDTIRADPGQIEQVLINLAVNARDAMPQGGTLTLETANILLDEVYVSTHPYVQPGPHVMLSVSDTGCGMSAEVQEHIFEPFFTTKEVGQGTGLGLSTVYGIVKQSGGSIEVSSVLNVGTIFTIYLPRANEAPDTVDRAVRGLPRGHEEILVVEDQAEVRRLTVRMLQRLGYTVLEAASGTEALALLQSRPNGIHLLVTDVVMPEMSGVDLVEHIRQAGWECRVLYVSGYTNEAIAQHGLLEPGTHLVQKPFAIEHLAQRVRQVLDAPA